MANEPVSRWAQTSSAMLSPAIAALMAQGAIQPTLFGETDMAQISHPDYSGQRLIACYDPFLAAERARKRGELLEATKDELKKNRRRHPAGPSAGAQ